MGIGEVHSEGEDRLARGQLVLFDFQQLHIKYECRIGWDHAARSTGAVAQLRGNGQFPLPAYLHPSHSFIPSLDDLP